MPTRFTNGTAARCKCQRSESLLKLTTGMRNG
jgi:hypothetical protein